MKRVQIILIGLAAGIVSGLIGIGGAIILVPGMIYFVGLTQYMASATSLAVIIPGAVVSTAVYHSFGQLDISLTLLFALGGIAGSFVGSSLMPHIKAVVLKRIWAVVALLMAIKMGMG
jgi:uncharacterized membrane protein YfcA